MVQLWNRNEPDTVAKGGFYMKIFKETNKQAGIKPPSLLSTCQPALIQIDVPPF